MGKIWLAISVFLVGMGTESVLSLLDPIFGVGVLLLGIWGIVAYFLWVKCSGWLKWGGIVFVSLLVGISTYYFPSKLAKPTIDARKVQLFLQYAHEWDNYLGATYESGNMSKIITKPIEKTYSSDKHRLLLGVFNGNKPLSINNVWLHIFFLDDNLNVEVETDKVWRSMIPNKHYFAPIANTINSEAGHHPSENLWIRFPKPGTYQIRYKISGADFEIITGIFEIILRPHRD